MSHHGEWGRSDAEVMAVEEPEQAITIKEQASVSPESKPSPSPSLDLLQPCAEPVAALSATSDACHPTTPRLPGPSENCSEIQITSRSQSPPQLQQKRTVCDNCRRRSMPFLFTPRPFFFTAEEVLLFYYTLVDKSSTTHSGASVIGWLILCLIVVHATLCNTRRFAVRQQAKWYLNFPWFSCICLISENCTLDWVVLFYPAVVLINLQGFDVMANFPAIAA